MMLMRNIVVPAMLAAASLANADPLSTSFTYQGELRTTGALADGEYDFQVEVYDALSAGVLVGSAILIDNVGVSGGVFAMELNFGAVPFAGNQLWLEISVRDGASTGGYTILLPRQKLTAAPYALHAEMVAVDAVGNSEIADNAVGPLEIDASQSYTINGLVNNGSTLLHGQLVVDSVEGIKVLSDSTEMAWFAADGTTRLGRVLFDSNRTGLYDDNRARWTVFSDADGVALASEDTTPGYAATVPSLSVTGVIDIGYEIVTENYDLNILNASCPAHGGNLCYYGAVTVNCPVGKKVLGGGTQSGLSGQGGVYTSIPNGSMGWNCGATASSSIERTCFAICARVN